MWKELRKHPPIRSQQLGLWEQEFASGLELVLQEGSFCKGECQRWVSGGSSEEPRLGRGCL